MSADLNLNRLLGEAKRHDVACILLSNDYADRHGKYEVLAGFGAEKEWLSPEGLNMDEDLLLGFCSYELKNSFERLDSLHPAVLDVPDFYFFKPQLHFRKGRDGEIITNFPDQVETTDLSFSPAGSLDFKSKTTVEQYLKNVNRIKDCIVRGDFYEMNYCLEFTAAGEFDPFAVFFRLNQKSPAPFAAFFKYHDRYLLCSSPERFLAKRGEKLISQPIKGTRRRKGLNDDAVVEELRKNEKDRAENVMIADLVRNDLSRICKPGTVVVDELCEVYSFSHVHQMISTVSGELNENTGFAEILKAAFPMGSMTGAPKIQVMQDIEKFENFRRGWYSGSIGYIAGGNFDLNVVIRSLQLKKDENQLHYHVGGAITIDSIPEDEYQECLHKAAGMIQALTTEGNQASSNL